MRRVILLAVTIMMHMRRGADRGHAFALLAVPGSEMRQAPDFVAHAWMAHSSIPSH